MFHRKVLSYETIKLREDRTAAERKMSQKRPAAGGVSRKRDTFLLRKRLAGDGKFG